MLVLSRKTGESILIGNNIEIKILKIDGGEVKIGVTAPKNMKIYRKELYEKIMKENIEASKIAVEDIKEVPKIDKGNGRPDKAS
ncbi:MAG: carbon storage regulator CsrA [Thermotogaceae bacterium]|nr:carbon storage regulator CsrA [Thermotogaceae bacterium]